jgi:signal transduction histidine kinase
VNSGAPAVVARTKLECNAIEWGELGMAELSTKGGVAHGQRQRPAANDLARRWGESIGLAVAIGLGYFLAARLSVGLVLEPASVAVFWPAAGISSGVLIALGLPRAGWPVAVGVTVATVAIHELIADPFWVGTALGLSNAAEALITAGLIKRYFGADFNIDRLRQVLGLLLAAIVGTAVSGIGGVATYRLWNGPSATLLTTWEHWFASDAIGIVIVAPLVIGLAAAIRQPPPRNELVEGAVVLAALAVMTGISISLPQASWETVVPIALLFPMLLWLAARCRPVFAAAAVFLVSITVVSSAVIGTGHFGDASLPLDDRIPQAQAAILFVALGAYVLAALFAERMESETRLARANVLLERERDNKLMSAEAITAAIAHEVRQPLASIVTNANAALRWLGRTPPDHDEVRSALTRIQNEGHRTSEVFDAIRALFRTGDGGRQKIDVNEIVVEVLQSLQAELKENGVDIRPELAELPLVDGHKGQLRGVISNLVHNALEALNTTTDRNRILRVTSELRGPGAIAVAVEDSGPGIDPEKLDRIFTAFVTTKSQGMGLGLAICRMIIEQHGGQLTASSDGKNGALFQFVLPIASAADRSI